MLALLQRLFYSACDPQSTFWEALCLLSPVLHWLGSGGWEQEHQTASMYSVLVH